MSYIHVNSPERAEYACRVIGKLPLDLPGWDCQISRHVERRSLEQNARLHAIFGKVALATGSDIESVKLGYKALFLAGKETDFHGRKIMVYPKTSKMKKPELSSFMEQCETHAITEFGVFLGMPNE